MVADNSEGGGPDGVSDAALPLTAPQKMRAGREAAGMSLADVALATRVPQRHLEALENGDYGALPSITYCTGFTRAYARAVGIDPVSLVAQVRDEVNQSDENARAAQAYEEAADPARVPPRWLAIATLVLVALLLGAYAIWRAQMNAVPMEAQVVPPPPPPQPVANVAAGSVASSVPAPSGPVVITALEDVWMRVYEQDGRRYFDQTLTRGSSFTVPADAANPLILTGRPDALAVTIGGKPVPPLGTAERTISDVPISAAALLARPPGGTAPAAGTGNAAEPADARPPAQRPRASRSAGNATAISAPAPAPAQAASPPSAANGAAN